MSSPSDWQDRLRRERNLWVATVRADGRPHLIPVWFTWILEKIYICIEPKSVKARNLAQNAKVSVALEGGSHPVICEGTAIPLPKPWPAKVVSEFETKYDWNIAAETQYTQLVEITPVKWLKW